MSSLRPSNWRFAAIVYCQNDDVSAALALAVSHARRAGLRIGGLMQRFGKEIAKGKREILVEVLHSGEVIRLHDPRGRGVQGCMLDADGLARAAVAFRTAAMSRPDLLLAGRFGKEEAQGGGMRAEMAEALISGVPVLMPVRTDLFSAWQSFVGGPTEVLAPEPRALLEWIDQHCRRNDDSRRAVLPRQRPAAQIMPLGLAPL
jgi:molybdate transport system ATP-binding protein